MSFGNDNLCLVCYDMSVTMVMSDQAARLYTFLISCCDGAIASDNGYDGPYEVDLTSMTEKGPD